MISRPTPPAGIGEFLLNSLLLVMAGAFIYQSRQIGLGSLTLPGPGLFPFIAAVLLAACLVTRMLHQILKPDEAGAQPALPPLARRNILITGYVLTLSAAYILAFETVGFLISTSIWMFGLFVLHSRRNLLLGLFGALLTAFVTYYLFVKQLNLQLPCGSWCF